MKRKSQLMGILFSLSALAGLAPAQETRGSLSEIVSDGSGAVVPAATMQLTNAETGVVLSTTSNRKLYPTRLFCI